MISDHEKRLEAFEKMLLSVKEQYETADAKMKQLKGEGKEKQPHTVSLWAISCSIRTFCHCINSMICWINRQIFYVFMAHSNLFRIPAILTALVCRIKILTSLLQRSNM